MESKEITRVDHGDLVDNALASQYINSTKLKALIHNIAREVSQDIEDQSLQILNMCDIDNSTGDILDAVGSLIGLPRMAVAIGDPNLWILDNTPFEDHTFADRLSIDFETASDEIYRDAIRSYAICRGFRGSLSDLYDSLKLLLGVTDDTSITVTQTDAMTVTVTITATLDPRRQYLVQAYLAPNSGKLWPAVAGVDYTFPWTIIYSK